MIKELQKYSSLESDDYEERFVDILQKMTQSGNKEYLGPILRCLDDESWNTDIMKMILGMAETWPIQQYIRAVIENYPYLMEKAPDWLEIILSRIRNSEEYHKELLLQTKKGKSEIF